MLGLMLASLAVATLGWALARIFYKDEAEHAKLRAANRLRYENLHAFAFDKYRVDELYEATFVRAFVTVARAAAWLDEVVVDGVVAALAGVVRTAAWLSGAIDRYLVDGAVNGVAEALLGGGREAPPPADRPHEQLRARRRRGRRDPHRADELAVTEIAMKRAAVDFPAW